MPLLHRQEETVGLIRHTPNSVTAQSEFISHPHLDDNDSDTTEVPSREGSPSRTWKRSRGMSDSSLLSEDYMSSPIVKPLSRSGKWLRWCPWAVSTALQVLIVFLVLTRSPQRLDVPRVFETEQELSGVIVETGGDVNGLYKEGPHTYRYLKSEAIKFMPNMTSNVDRMVTRSNWDALMPLGSGSLAIPDYASHPLLGNPIVDDPLRSGPIFEASWTHALHCLYYALDSHHQLLLKFQDPTYDIDTYHTSEVHASHCFEYLRNNIMCNLDMTLEGDQSLPGEKDKGQGHVCRNYEVARQWIEDRRLDDLQDIVGP